MKQEGGSEELPGVHSHDLVDLLLHTSLAHIERKAEGIVVVSLPSFGQLAVGFAVVKHLMKPIGHRPQLDVVHLRQPVERARSFDLAEGDLGSVADEVDCLLAIRSSHLPMGTLAPREEDDEEVSGLHTLTFLDRHLLHLIWRRAMHRPVVGAGPAEGVLEQIVEELDVLDVVE